MGKEKREKKTESAASNRNKIVDIRYRRLLRDVMAIPIEEARADVGDTKERVKEDETASMLAYIFASGR